MEDNSTNSMEMYAERIIKKWQAGGKTPVLVARPGAGKTAFVEYLAKKLNTNLHVYNLATFEAVDLNGIPYLDQDTHAPRMSVPAFAADLKDGDIIFWDEVNLANAEVRNGLQTMLLSHKLADGTKLPDVKFICAMNTTSDLDSVSEFSNAMKDRFAFIPFHISEDGWKKMFKDNFGKDMTPREKQVREKIAAFLNTNPHLLEGRKPIKASAYGITDEVEAMAIESATPNRRNWDNLARELALTTEDDEKQFRKNMFIETVGLECWRNYKEYISTENKPLSTYKWDGEPDEITQQINRLKAEKNVDKQAEYFVRAYKYCKNKEVITSIASDVFVNVFSKYFGEWREKLPEFGEIIDKVPGVTK